MTVTVHSGGTCQGGHEGREDTAMTSLRQPKNIDQKPPEYTEQYLLDRLIAAGVGTLENWRALSPRARRNIFGITIAMARAIDGMAKRATAS